MRDFFRRRRGSPGKAEESSAVLTEQQHALVDEELAILNRLAILLDAYPATEEDRRQIADAKEQLTSLFLLVVVGSSMPESPHSSTRSSAVESCPRA